MTSTLCTCPTQLALNTLLNERVLLMDGGMGTQIFAKKPTAEDYGGAQFEGCVELLNHTRREWIQSIHENYYRAGADAVETNTFGCNPIVLGEFGVAHRAFELNKLAVENALEVARSFGTQKFVVASVGPGSKLRTLGHVTYQEMHESYLTQMRGIMAGGAHAILIETTQDIAQIKIAVRAARAVFAEVKKEVPIWVQVTIESSGTMLLGTDIQAALVALEPLGVQVLGMNCATGPAEMRTHLAYLCENSPMLVSCQPNAGLPQNVCGQTIYPLNPEAFASAVVDMCAPLGINILGGCCGTTPDHIAAVAKQIHKIQPKKRPKSLDRMVSSLYSTVPLAQNPRPLFVGERTNANGSNLFKNKLKENNIDAMVDIAKSQLKEGAHVLDVSVACVSRDELSDMEQFVTKLATQVNIPIMVDSTEYGVMEKALQCAPGKCIVNSINFEDGETKARKVLQLCKTFGAAVVALTIDETGMARTTEHKLRVARRLFQLATQEYNLSPGDVIIDPLTFTLGSGSDEWRDSALETLDAIEAIKQEIPGVNTILGLSNVSFGLSPAARQILNSVMLYHAVNRGLDMAILNASKILPLSKISDTQRQLFEDVLFNSRKNYADPLKTVLELFPAGTSAQKNSTVLSGAQPNVVLSIEERLKQDIIDGEKLSISQHVTEALSKHSAIHIINSILLVGMKTVGERFGKGEMQLPFVLESAETMKIAMTVLEPHIEKKDGMAKGKIVLATVKGDVHDIGKNLVDIILSNNGFEVVNLGIKQPIQNIIEAAKRENPTAIGLSGLLVKSTAIMKEDLAEMHAQGFTTPVILGGAALTREFVETECRDAYKAQVHYAEDAFEGLSLMEAISEGKELALKSPKAEKSHTDLPQGIVVKRRGESKITLTELGQSPWVKQLAETPVAPWFGTQIFHDSLNDIFPYLDEFALVRGRWEFTQGTRSEADFAALLQTKAMPLLQSLKQRVQQEKLFTPAAIAGFFPACSADDGNTIRVYNPNQPPNTPLDRREVVAEFNLPRQSHGHRLCIADFLRHESHKQCDVLGMQIVTMGPGASEAALRKYGENKFSEYFYLHGLSTELTEAYAELMHARLRKMLNIHNRDAANMRALFSQGYQGSRYSFGYPACPEMESNQTVIELLQAQRIGVSLTESFQMIPEQTTCAIVLHHPQARYFSV